MIWGLAACRAAAARAEHTGAVPYVPLVVAGLACGAVALTRWVFAPPRRRAPDYGLLVAAASYVPASDAERARDSLRLVGIRATVGARPEVVHVDAAGHARRTPAGYDVLVFPGDLTRARAALERV